MARRDAREFVMQIIFQIEAQKDFDNPDIEKYLSGKDLGKQNEYVRKLVTEIVGNIKAIDTLINNNSQGWPTSRMAKTDLAVTRVAVGEIMFIDDVPKAVAINEAVNLAKVYGTEQSDKFINAILGKIN